GLPGWVAALITAAVLGVAAWSLRGAARPHHPAAAPENGSEIRVRHRDDALRGPMPTGAPGVPYPTAAAPLPESTPDPRQRPI
ncbi:phage holin family protein, partial [Streptomyces sp. S6]